MRFQAPALALRLDAATRLGVVPLVCLARHRLGSRFGRIAASLGVAEASAGPFLTGGAPTAPPIPAAHRAAILSAAARLGPVVFHGPFDPAAPALTLDLFAPGDVRPVWEANRLAWLPLLVQAHRLDPSGGHLGRAEARLAEWIAANPPWRGPNWACGQEAALRALHLTLALGLLEAPPTPGMAVLLRLHARRIAATRHYARAQDNNHPVSEAAGLYAIALALGDAAGAARAARDLAAVVARLVGADGAYAVVSTGYHRLLLDTLSVAEWLRRHHGATPLPDPIPARAAAATRWLARLTCAETGATPRLGHQDGSRLADLSLAGPDDARGSVERAARLFGEAIAGGAGGPDRAAPSLPTPDDAHGGSAGRVTRLLHGASTGSADEPDRAAPSLSGSDGMDGDSGRMARLFGGALTGGADGPGGAASRPSREPAASAGGLDDPGRAWLDLPPGPPLPAEESWMAEGTRGWRDGATRLLLRTGPLRFRPGHADLLHLDLWQGSVNLLRDAGTGAYNPPADRAWWADHFPSARAHNTITFDDAEPMPRAGRFLFARWPATEALPGGAAVRDSRGNRHARTVRREGEDWIVEDRVSGPFRSLALRWHLSPGAWRVEGDAVVGDLARLLFEADAPVAVSLGRAWESRAYGEASRLPCAVLRAPSNLTRIVTRIRLRAATGDCKRPVDLV